MYRLKFMRGQRGRGVGGGAGTSDSLVASLTFVSTSGGLQTNVPHRFWMGFNKGDVPSTSKLVLFSGGVERATQYDQVNTWSDGSIRCCVFRAFIPSLGAGATHKWDIYKRTGTYSASAARTTSDITASDFKVTFADLRDDTDATVGSGTFTGSVNTNIAVLARTRKIATGPICDVWRTWGKITDDIGGAENGFLTTDACIEVWTDPVGGGVYAISHSHWVRSGWRNVASPKSYIYTAKLKDGASTVLSFDGANSFTSTDVNTTTEEIATTDLQTGECVRATTTGSLPGGMATTTNYWCRRAAGGGVSLYTCPQSSFNGGSTNRINLTDGGSGTHTLTRYIGHHYHTGWHTRAADGKEEWTANEPLLRPAWTAAERTYLQRSGFAWPFDLTANPTSLTQASYYPGSLAWASGETSGPIRPGFDDTGDHAMLYVWGRCASIAWLKMGAADIQSAHVLGLCAAHLSMTWMDETLVSGHENARCLVLNNGTYTGMGTALAGTGYYNYHGGNAAAAVWTYLGSGLSQANLERGPALVSSDASHWPQLAYVPYLMTGDPHFLDAMYFAANHGLWTTNAANAARVKTYPSVAGTTYYGNWPHWIQQRAEAYMLRDALYAAVCAPDADPENDYFTDIVNDGLAYHVAYRSGEDASYSDYGHWTPRENSWGGGLNYTARTYLDVGGFQANWLAMAHLQCHRLWRTTNAQTIGEHFAKFSKMLGDAGSLMGTGPYWANSFTFGIRANRTDSTWRAPANWGVGTGSTNTDWGAANVITTTSLDVANDDQVFFNELEAQPPAEITKGANYFVKSLSGATHKISDTLGGADKSFTSQAQDTRGYYIYAITSGVGFGGGNSGYAQMLTAAICMAAAYGLSGYSAIASNLLTRLSDETWALSDDPRFSFSASVL